MSCGRFTFRANKQTACRWRLVTYHLLLHVCKYFSRCFAVQTHANYLAGNLKQSKDLQKGKTIQTKHGTVGKRPLGEMHLHLISIVDPISGVYECKAQDNVKLWGCRCHRTKLVCAVPAALWEHTSLSDLIRFLLRGQKAISRVFIALCVCVCVF